MRARIPADGHLVVAVRSENRLHGLASITDWTHSGVDDGQTFCQKLQVFDRNQPQGNRLMPNPVDAKIGSQIRSLRISKDMTEEVLADRIGVTFRQMRRYERGTSRVSIVQLTEIAGALGVSVSTFFNAFAKSEPENDNLTPLQIATKQGLTLLRMFHSIADAQIRYKVLKTVEAMASERVTTLEEPRR